MQWKAVQGTVEGRILGIVLYKLLRYSFTVPDDIVTLVLDEENERTTLSVRHGDFSTKENAQECYAGALGAWELNMNNITKLAETQNSIQKIANKTSKSR